MVGVLKSAEKRSTFSPDNKPETRQLLWAEKASLLQAAGLNVLDPHEAGVNSVPILMEAVGESGGAAFSLCHDTIQDGFLSSLMCSARPRRPHFLFRLSPGSEEGLFPPQSMLLASFNGKRGEGVEAFLTGHWRSRLLLYFFFFFCDGWRSPHGHGNTPAWYDEAACSMCFFHALSHFRRVRHFDQNSPSIVDPVTFAGDENDDSKSIPVVKKPRHFGDFYVMPQTHLMYSATW